MMLTGRNILQELRRKLAPGNAQNTAKQFKHLVEGNALPF